MPELPEVEHLKRSLESCLPGKRLAQVHCFRKDLRFDLPVSNLSKLCGEEVLGLKRRAKYIIFNFGQMSLLSHLGMTGSWRWSDVRRGETHDHLSLEFSDSSFLVYKDPRRFGFIDCGTTAEGFVRWLGHLGPEPLDAEFSADYLFQLTRRRPGPIKSFLMNQKNVVGVGNIYASEALFLSGIHPFRAAQSLSLSDCRRLTMSICEVLTRSIELGGTTFRDYRGLSGEKGENLKELFVYGREGDYCHLCGFLVRSEFLSGRSTFWCPNCQN